MKVGKILKTAVISGVAGFLGSYLAKALLSKGYHVVGIDNLSTGRNENLKTIQKNDRFHFVQADVSTPDVLELQEWDKIDEIYHLASPASPKFYGGESAIGTIAVNTIGTKNMLELAKRFGSKFLFSSTSETYGDPLIHPQPETYRGNVNTWGPRACYDEAKRLGETYCYIYSTLYNVPTKIVRIFNTYSAGLRNDDGRVISNFVTQALLGRDITVYGDGLQTRSFCYVDDTVRALMLMMDSDRATNEIINIGNPHEYTILEIAHIVKKLTQSDSKIIFLPLPLDDPQKRKPDISKARTLLGWEPMISLEEGLKKTIETYKERLCIEARGERDK